MSPLITILMILQGKRLSMSKKSSGLSEFSGSGPLKTRVRTIIACTPLWQCALFASMLVVLILSTAPIEGPAPVTGWDKLNHLIAFVELTILARLGWPAQSRLRAGLAILAFGLLIELIQATLAWRSCSVADLLADGLGILVGLAVIHKVPHFTEHKL